MSALASSTAPTPVQITARLGTALSDAITRVIGDNLCTGTDDLRTGTMVERGVTARTHLR